MQPPADYRRWSILPPNTGSAMPRQLIFLDCETTPFPDPDDPKREVHTFRLACASSVRYEGGRFTRRKEIDALSPSELWEWVASQLRPNATTWLFAHNAGFDLTVSEWWDRVLSGEYIFRGPDEYGPGKPGQLFAERKSWSGFAVLDDPPVILCCKRDKCRLNIVDTLNYWQQSLASLGEEHGLEKLTMPAFSAPDHSWLIYCRRDVEILERAILSILNQWSESNLGTFGMTASSLAFNAFRHRFMGQKIYLHGSRPALELERGAYYGGQCSAYYLGHVRDPQEWHQGHLVPRNEAGYPEPIGPVWHLDIDSLYPDVMARHAYPVRLVKVQQGPETPQYLQRYDAERSIAEVTVRVEDDTLPVRMLSGEPVADRAASDPEFQAIYAPGTQTWHAEGRFRTYLAGPELAYALAMGYVERIHTLATYEVAKIFGSYVEYFHGLKRAAEEAGNEGMRRFYKLLLNSLFGKFGQKSQKWLTVTDVVSPLPWGQWWRQVVGSTLPVLHRTIGRLVQRKGVPGEGRYSFPAVAAFVTAWGRMRMRQLREEAGRGHVYYQDTDSLHVDAIGLERLQKRGRCQDGAIGQLRVVEKALKAEYRGIKNYSLGDKQVVAGLRRGNVPAANGEYNQLQFQRLHSILAGRPNGKVTVTQSTFTIRENLPPGERQPTGWMLPPLLGVQPPRQLD